MKMKKINNLALLILSIMLCTAFFMQGCKKDKGMEITTTAVTKISISGAESGGTVLNDGGSTITARGVCWSTSKNPTVSDSKTNDGSESGSFVSTLSGLSMNTTYYIRAYATTSSETYYGNELSFKTSATLAIGDHYGGGVVAYILKQGDPGYHLSIQKGLIAATSDLNASWGCPGTNIAGTSTALGTGKANTDKIVATCTTSGIAARLCDELVLNGYNDWYLPSKDELNKIRIARDLIGGFVGESYWTSSQIDKDDAWTQSMLSGFQTNFGKNLPVSLRPVRSF